QVYPGRFSLWPYDSYCYPFLTVYSLDYLLSAREAGYRIPEELFRDTQNATRALLQSAPQSLEGLRTISYAAWVYVRSGQRFTGLPQLIRDLDNNLNKKWRSEPSAALLAACFKMMQQDKEADELLKNVRALDGKSYTNSWFYCRLWENSLFLTALARHFPEQLTSYEGNKALVQIINDVGSGDYSSPCAAQAVRAIADYAASNLGRKENLLLQALDAQGKILPGEGAGEALKRLSLGHEAASFRFSGAEDLYWQISADGFDLNPAPPKAAKISLATRYIPAGGKKLEDLGQGDEVYVLISAAATAATDNVAITSLLPGGFEMVISKAGQIVGGGASGRARSPDREDDDDDGEYNDEDYEDHDDRDSSWNLDETASYPNQTHMREAMAMLEEAGIQGQPMNLVHVERREDRMVAYASLGKDERLFIYRIKAINKGKFTLPSAFAEALYDPEARANTGPGSLEVR
ncbi:MAG: hypothetical protein FWF99_07480, partial [Desulfovibrionaceae bacterium]|nr:hypothetical protein [Desulfovibrionaceae bacterium]